MKKHKAGFQRAAMFITAMLLILFTTTSFTGKKVMPSPTKNEYYFFFSTTPKEVGVMYNKKRYLSTFIYYTGYDACSYNYDFERKAKNAFENYIKAQYDEEMIDGTMTISTKLFSTDKATTRQQLSEKMNAWIADEKKDGHIIIHTNFSYSCE